MSNTTPTPEALQLMDWPRGQMQPTLRLEYQRAYPEGSPLLAEVATRWAPFRMAGADAWPPMRDAVVDTLDFLMAVAHDLNVRGLHCLEVSVSHTNGAYVKGATETGWQYHATVLAIPTPVAQEQRAAFEAQLAKAEADLAATK